MRNTPKKETIEAFLEMYNKCFTNRDVAIHFFRLYLNTTPEDYIKKLNINDHTTNKENQNPNTTQRKSKTKQKRHKKALRTPLSPIREEYSTTHSALLEVSSILTTDFAHSKPILINTPKDKYLTAANEVVYSKKVTAQPSKVAWARKHYGDINRKDAHAYRLMKDNKTVIPSI